MKRFLLPLFLLALALQAQVNPASPVLAGGPPGGIGGACAAGSRMYANLTTGVLASCVSGIWTAFGSSAGGLPVNNPVFTGTLSGPVANISATTGNSSVSSLLTSGGSTPGSTSSYIEPMCTNPSFGNFQASTCLTTYQGGLFNPANYGNLAGIGYSFNQFNGRNAYDNSDKKTTSGIIMYTNFSNSGQKFGINNNVLCNGTGDCFGQSNQITAAGPSTATGDEGVDGSDTTIQEVGNLLVIPTNGLTVSSCAATSLTVGVPVKSQNPTDILTVAVNSSTGCAAGDWLTIDQGIFESHASGTINTSGTAVTWNSGSTFTLTWVGTYININGVEYLISSVSSDTAMTISASAGVQTNVVYSVGDLSVETVHLTAAGGGTISALFQTTHAAGAPVVPSPVLLASALNLNQTNDNRWGQDRIVVDLSGTSYSTGTISTIVDKVVTGTGTLWKTGHTNGPVGGDVNLPGCISFTADNFSQGPFTGGAGPLVSWFPIQSIDSDTQLTLSRTYSGKAPAGSAAYTNRQCGIVGNLDMDYTPPKETIKGIVLRSNAFPWTSGHSVEETISPYMVFSRGHLAIVNWYGPMAASQSTLFEAINYGYTPIRYGYDLSPSPTIDDSTHAGYLFGYYSRANTAEAQFAAIGRSLNGEGIFFGALDSADPKAIHWEGIDSTDIFPSTAGFTIAPLSGKVRFAKDGALSASTTLDFSGLSGTPRTLTVPDASGLLQLANPGPLTRTLLAAANDPVELGSYALGGQGTGNFELYIATSGNDVRSKSYRFWTNFNSTGGAWQRLAPLTDSGLRVDVDYDVDIKVDSNPTAFLRVRRTAGAANTTATISLYQYGFASPFTPSTTDEGVVTAPTVTYAATVLGQINQTATITNAGGFVATIDPTGLTGNQTFTPPNASGTLALMSGTPTSNAVLKGTGTAAIASGCIIDSSNNLSCPGTVTSGTGSGVAGTLDLTQGTLPGSFPANTASIYSPTSISTSYQWRMPVADAAGAIVSSGAGTPGVLSIKGIQGTDTNLLSSGTISGTGASLCTDANGGATTTGCSGGGSVSITGTSPVVLTPSPTTGTGVVSIASSPTFNGATTLAGTSGVDGENILTINRSDLTDRFIKFQTSGFGGCCGSTVRMTVGGHSGPPDTIFAGGLQYNFDAPVIETKLLGASTGTDFASAPTFTPGTGAGSATGGTCSGDAQASDIFGTISCTTGTVPVASGVIVTVTFGTAYVNAHCSVTPASATAAGLSGTGMVFPSTGNTTQFTVTAGVAALGISTTYSWNYVCGG